MLKRIGAEESGEFKAVASGTLPSGRPVVVNADGTVSVVAETTVTEGFGSPVVFESANTTFNSAVYDSNAQKVVIAYTDGGNSSYGTAIVGTVSGTSISFGTAVVFESASSSNMSAIYDTNAQKVVIAYTDVGGSEHGTAIVGTVSGTSISFGSPTVFESASTEVISAAYDANAQKVVIAYRDFANSSKGTAVVGTVSGTSISFGSPVIFENASTSYISAIYDASAQKVVIAYRDNGNSYYGTAIVGTVSGTSISFGSAVVFESANSEYISGVYDSNAQKVVIAYQDGGNSNYGTAIVGTVSGTSISFGSAVVFESGMSSFISATYDANVQKVVIAYRDSDNSNYGTVIVGTVSGTSISFGSASIFESANSDYISAIYDANVQKVVIAYRDRGNSDYGTSIIFQNASTSQNLTSENYIGMSRGVVFQSESAASTPSLGGATVFRSGETDDITSAYDTNSNKLVVAYIESNVQGAGTAVVGTVSGTSITFGSPVTFESSNISGNVKMTFDSSSNKIVIAYRANNLNGVAIVGTVSGTSISFGSAVTFLSSRLEGTTIAFDSNSNKVVIAYNDYDNGGDGKAVVGTVSGTSISFGSAVTFETGTFSQQTSVFDSNSNKVVIAYSETSGSVFYAIVGTVSGTSISFGSKTTIFSGATTSFASTFDSDTNKIMVLYTKDDANSYGNLVVGTVSGTSISFGSEVVFKSGTVYQRDCSYDTAVNKVIISFRDASNSNKMTYLFATISGTSASISSETVSTLTDSRAISSVYDPDSGGTLVSFTNGSTTYGTTQVVNSSAIITTRGEVASGGNASMDIIGSVSDNQIGLTTGQQYFVQTDGTISTTAGSPSVLAGTAISATELVVKT